MTSLTGTAPDRAEAIADRCKQATYRGDTWHACCPAHDDARPSLSITASGNRVLLKCHTGCEATEIVAALGLTMADLFVDPPATNGHKRIVKVYDYTDAAGALVHQTVRYHPKDFKQRRPDPVHPEDYIWNLQGITPVLYHLPQVLAAIARGDTIFLVEGEK